MARENSNRRFDFQQTLLEKGFDQIQQQIRHLDEILFKIKASAITVWIAIIGWSLAAKVSTMVPLGGVAIIGFWILEAMFKGAQLRYIAAAEKLSDLVNDREALDRQFEQEEFDRGIIYPLGKSRSELERLALLYRGMISATVATIYLFLGFVNFLVWLAVHG